ncbi:hypothetical protein LLEC1_02253 [Akanthomyces lecanii]|uniref:Zn(2)-C6 fungal-type domain-containing protein n=1 Tax=Cordyceps confragosa TaxID=2714763 RepID=A0A179I444_CORDF|nr:hypothetical protein LLEC1_02253 [Akanthomyces lecanii]
MTRSKVLDEQRKRIGQACKGCQNRKQKCDGQAPCSGCEKRGHACTYDPDRKRKSISRIPKHGVFGPASKTLPLQFQGQAKLEPGNSSTLRSPLGGSLLHSGAYEPSSAMSEWSSASDMPPDRYESAAATRAHSQVSASVCGSSTASFLAEIKKLVLPLAGPCPFTQSQENFTRLRSNAHPPVPPDTVPLPDRQVAEQLVSAAGQYSNHLVEILDESMTQKLLQTCYSGLRPQEPGRTCLLYLLLAAGSASLEAQKKPQYSGSESPLSDTLGEADRYFDYVEATMLRIGSFEHFEIWMIQAWALMTIYSLSASKWNAADAYIGLAVRAAYVLGINQVQGASPRAAPEGKASAVHAKLWKCLFVLDSLVAALLGRQPQALKEDKCKPTAAPGDCSPSSPNSGRDDCLEFNVASAKAIRKTLKLVYNPRHFPAEKAHSMLHQAQLQPPLGPADSSATLHARLFRNYAMMLLTRPFFVQELYQLSKQKFPERLDTTWRQLSETCITTAHHTIECIFDAYNQPPQLTNDYIWRRAGKFRKKETDTNLSLHRQCLFTAVLIILSNQFFGFYESPNSETTIVQAFTVLDQCSSVPSSDYMESAVPQLNTWNGFMPSINPPPRCGSDAGCYGLVPPDGYAGDAVQMSQEYTAFPGQQVYLS